MVRLIFVPSLLYLFYGNAGSWRLLDGLWVFLAASSSLLLHSSASNKPWTHNSSEVLFHRASGCPKCRGKCEVELVWRGIYVHGILPFASPGVGGAALGLYKWMHDTDQEHRIS